MQKTIMKLLITGGLAALAGLCCAELAYSQLRVPPTYVTALAAQPVENAVSQETDAGVRVAQPTSQVAPPPEMTPQVQPQLQIVIPQAIPQQAMSLGMTSGAIIIPVVVPQYMTYTPQPVTMMVNRPAQLVIPQYPPQMMAPMPQPMMQPMYDPMAMPMMMQQPIMPMVQPQAPPQQPIPVKMILPDGSTVSIKHYIPGQFFKNTLRAITP